jgi:hypothetical protein
MKRSPKERLGVCGREGEGYCVELMKINGENNLKMRNRDGGCERQRE